MSEHEVRVECVCGDTHIGKGGSVFKLQMYANDFWNLHQLCKQGDEPLSEFEEKVLSLFGEDDKKVGSEKYSYVDRRMKALLMRGKNIVS